MCIDVPRACPREDRTDEDRRRPKGATRIGGGWARATPPEPAAAARLGATRGGPSRGGKEGPTAGSGAAAMVHGRLRHGRRAGRRQDGAAARAAARSPVRPVVVEGVVGDYGSGGGEGSAGRRRRGGRRREGVPPLRLRWTRIGAGAGRPVVEKGIRRTLSEPEVVVAVCAAGTAAAAAAAARVLDFIFKRKYLKTMRYAEQGLTSA